MSTYFVKPTNSATTSDATNTRLLRICSNFEEMSEDNVLKIIWAFCYNPEFSWEKNHLPEEDFDSSLSVVRRELLRMIKYLFYDTWKELTAAPATDAERELSKKLSNTENAFGFVRKRLSSTEIATKKAFERIRFLLVSEKDENNFGGLKALGFNRLEALFLKDASAEIAAVVEERFAGHEFEESKASDNVSEDKPNDTAEVTAEIIEDSEVTATDTETSEAATEPLSPFELIVTHQEELTKLKQLHNEYVATADEFARLEKLRSEYFALRNSMFDKGFTRDYLTTLLDLK